MSSQKVTLKEIIEKWKDLTTQSDSTRWDEMEAFFSDAEEAGITASEIMKRKNDVIRIWCPINWQEAQKLHPEWRERPWYDKRRRGTFRTFDKWYSDLSKREKEAKNEQPVRKPNLKVVGENFSPSAFEEEYYSKFENLTHEQVLAHRKKLEALERGRK